MIWFAKETRQLLQANKSRWRVHHRFAPTWWASALLWCGDVVRDVQWQRHGSWTAPRGEKKYGLRKWSGEAVNYRAVACALAAGEKVEAQRVCEGPPAGLRALSAPPGAPRTHRTLHANTRGARSLRFDGHMVPSPSFPELAPLGGPDNPNPIPTAVCTQWHTLFPTIWEIQHTVRKNINFCWSPATVKGIDNKSCATFCKMFSETI